MKIFLKLMEESIIYKIKKKSCKYFDYWYNNTVKKSKGDGKNGKKSSNFNKWWRCTSD